MDKKTSFAVRFDSGITTTGVDGGQAVVPHAKESLAELRQKGHPVTIYTDRDVEEVRGMLLKEDIPYDELMEETEMFADAADIVLDDRLINVILCRNGHPHPFIGWSSIMSFLRTIKRI